jgi:hypothetical protein
MTLYRTSGGSFHFGRTRPLGREAIEETLTAIAQREGGMAYLRSTMLHELPATLVTPMDNAEVVRQLGERIKTGSLSVVFLRPKDARVPAFLSEGAGPGSAEAPKNKAEDPKPSPIVPYEYPVVARVESDQVIDSTAKLNAELSALLFGMYGRQKRGSSIARTFVVVADEEGNGVKLASTNVDMKIGIELHQGPGSGRPPSTVPVTYVATAKTTGEQTKLAVERLSRQLTLQPNSASRPAPSVPETFVGVAGQTAEGAKSTTASLGQSLTTLMHAKPFVRVRASADSELE